MNEYRLVKIALREYLMQYMNLAGNQVFRAPPRPTDVTQYPVIIVRSATASKEDLAGGTGNTYNLVLGILTRAQTAEAASDELDDLLQQLDNVFATHGPESLTAPTDARWFRLTRLGQQTTFDNAVQDDVGWIVYGATAGVQVVELNSQQIG